MSHNIKILEIEKPSTATKTVTMSITAKPNNSSTTPQNSPAHGQITSITAPLPEVLANGDHVIKIKTDSIRDGDKLSYDSAKGLSNHEIVVTSLLAGAFAGALAKSVIAPLDRTKINFQINKDKKFSYRAAAIFVKDTYKNEGFLALWRGNSATMARIIPYASIQFTAHEQWNKFLRIETHPDDHFRRFLSGALAGLTASSLTYPLDLARARMAVTDKYSAYKTLRQVFIKIIQCEGPKTLFRGYVPTLLGVIPYAGMSFFTYDTLKREYFKRTGEKNPTTMYSLMFGAVAGVFGQSSSYPLDIVRRRMQTTGVTPNCQDKYLTIASTIKKIYIEEGIIKGFYKGLSMNWIKGPIAVGISFATYDHFKEFLRKLVHLHYR
uniref:CSON013042 protein n=1 Tax=Culicoides sonorensis TaxID=179676 RepID=A0A336M745_CULSO